MSAYQNLIIESLLSKKKYMLTTRSLSLFSVSLLLAATQVSACFQSPTTKPDDTDGLPPVETKPANSKYQPAFKGQTRVAAVKTTTAFKAEKIATKIKSPWAVVPMPDGRLLITLKGGTMQIHQADGSLVKAITGFPAVDDKAQGGMLDVALDPAFISNHVIYWSFSEKNGSGNLTAVAKGTLNEAAGTIENTSVIFRATPALNSNLHFGSRLAIDKEGYLYVSAGERSILEGRAQAQLLRSEERRVGKECRSRWSPYH